MSRSTGLVVCRARPASIWSPIRFAVDYVRLYQDTASGPRLTCDPDDHPTSKFIVRNHLLFGVKTEKPGVDLPLWLTVFLISCGTLSVLAGSLEAIKLATCGQAACCALILLWWVLDALSAVSSAVSELGPATAATPPPPPAAATVTRPATDGPAVFDQSRGESLGEVDYGRF